jgi:hypothetical protein
MSLHTYMYKLGVLPLASLSLCPATLTLSQSWHDALQAPSCCCWWWWPSLVWPKRRTPQ